VEDPDTKVKETKKKYGLLPMMAHSSVGQIGALNASSFCERINSCAKDVVSDLHTCLSDESIAAQDERQIHELHVDTSQDWFCTFTRESGI
jgi:hypothetical protein